MTGTKLAITTLLAVTLAASLVAGDDRPHRRRRDSRADFMMERQQAGMVRGTPVFRRIIGSREIDGYRQGGATVWFERNNVVGVTR